MQIGSATPYVAPLPLSQAARPASSDLSQPTPGEEPLSASAPATSDKDANLPDRASSPASGDEKEASPREVQQQRQDQLEIAELASRDREVRAHEQAHAAVGSAYAGAPTYTFSRGPDGKRYAIGGEVSIDSSPVPNDPEATLRKMELVQRAALAPAEPSAQDLRVAAQAAAQATLARAELAQVRREESATASEERIAQREERLAKEEERKTREDEKADEQQALSPPPRLDLYLRLAQLQAPEPAVDLLV